jgi:hypothetical protein
MAAKTSYTPTLAKLTLARPFSPYKTAKYVGSSRRTTKMHRLSLEILMATPRTKERSLWYTLGFTEPIADLAIMLQSFKAIAITVDRAYMDPNSCVLLSDV